MDGNLPTEPPRPPGAPPYQKKYSISTPSHYAHILAYTPPLTFEASTLYPDSKANRELQIKVVDGEGGVHMFMKNLGPLHKGDRVLFDLDIGRLPTPLVVSAQCACSFVDLVASDTLNASRGPKDFVEVRQTLYEVGWPSEEVVPLLEGKATFDFGPDLIHYTYLFDFDGTGEANLTMPSGRELFHIKFENGRAIEGHVSDASRPIETGTWTIRTKGTGSITLRIDSSIIPPENWAQLGMQAP